MTYLIFACLILLIYIVLSIKWPRVGFWLFKAFCMLLLIIGLYLALLFYMNTVDARSLNINLHPWKNYIIWRGLDGLIVAITVYVISQLPFCFMKNYPEKRKTKILKWEGLIYVSILVMGISYLATETKHFISDELKYGNIMVKRINEYNESHKDKCKSLEDLGLKPVKNNYYEYNGAWFNLKTDDTGYTLYFRNMQHDYLDFHFVYHSKKDFWEKYKPLKPETDLD